MQHFNGTGIIGLESLLRSITDKLVEAGFVVIANNGAASSNTGPTTTRVALECPTSIDPNAADQNWVIVLDASDSSKYLDAYVLPKVQLTSDFMAPDRSETEKIGKISRNSRKERNFIHVTGEWAIPEGSEYEAIPFGFNLHVTDHGVALHVHCESFDYTGRAFSWFCVQRGVAAGEETPGAGSPLFAIYSCGGGQAGNPDALSASSIERYVVIEKNVNSATKPISAVIPTPDGMPIINPLQQVSLMAGNKAVAFFPQAINTQRHVYFVTLDMLGYTSADVIATGSEVPLIPMADKIVFKAGCANGSDNRGMRVLFPVRPFTL